MRYPVREKIFAIGDDYWIEDENGDRAFYVDGKVLGLRGRLELRDPGGAVLAVIRKKLVSLRDTMTVEDGDGAELCTVRRKALTPLRDSCRVRPESGEELEVRGDLVGKEFDIDYEGERLARISRKWFRPRDTYAVEIEREDADAGVLVAVAVCVDRLTGRDDEEEREG